jgi:hypothetical protein
MVNVIIAVKDVEKITILRFRCHPNPNLGTLTLMQQH